MKFKILIYIISIYLICIILIITCTLNGVRIQLVGKWELDNFSLDDEDPTGSGQLIINSDDTYYIDIKFKKSSGFALNYAPFYCGTTDEVTVHVKEHGVISCNNNHLYFNPADGGSWNTYIYYYWENGILLEMTHSYKIPWFKLIKVF